MKGSRWPSASRLASAEILHEALARLDVAEAETARLGERLEGFEDRQAAGRRSRPMADAEAMP